jgi:hypothetical protein
MKSGCSILILKTAVEGFLQFLAGDSACYSFPFAAGSMRNEYVIVALAAN